MALKDRILIGDAEKQIEDHRKANHGAKVSSIARQLEQLKAHFVEVDLGRDGCVRGMLRAIVVAMAPPIV